MDIKFEEAKLIHKDTIFSWLDKPHMQEFWDMSPEHRDDIENFMNGRLKPSSYFDGIFTYWVGSYNGELYTLIMTSEENEETNPPDHFKPYLSKTGKTIGIDFCIGEEKYLNRGLAAPTLISFTEFFAREIDLSVDTYLIDPHTDNPRAIHVYEKAGFRVVREYIQDAGYFAESKGVLMVKTTHAPDATF